MACNEFLGSAGLGMAQGLFSDRIGSLTGLQAVQQQSGLAALAQLGGLTTTTNVMPTITIVDSAKTLVEELQAEISEWLPDL